MQNWRFIQDFAPLQTQGDYKRISDSGFTSTAHPKLKFNFTMDIKMRVPLLKTGSRFVGHDLMAENDIPLKSATRPVPNIVYQDLNYYNYRTRVATRTDFGSVSISMYDDADGKAHSVYQTYMEAISPMARNGFADDLVNDPTAVPFGGLSSIGSLPNNAHGIIERISLYHYYVLNNRTLRTHYRCINPKVERFELDDLSMSESDANIITMSFPPDGVSVREEVLNEDGSDII